MRALSSENFSPEVCAEGLYPLEPSRSDLIRRSYNECFDG